MVGSAPHRPGITNDRARTSRWNSFGRVYPAALPPMPGAQSPARYPARDSPAIGMV
jgi:hypothetical protein